MVRSADGLRPVATKLIAAPIYRESRIRGVPIQGNFQHLETAVSKLEAVQAGNSAVQDRHPCIERSRGTVGIGTESKQPLGVDHFTHGMLNGSRKAPPLHRLRQLNAWSRDSPSCRSAVNALRHRRYFSAEDVPGPRAEGAHLILIKSLSLAESGRA